MTGRPLNIILACVVVLLASANSNVRQEGEASANQDIRQSTERHVTPFTIRTSNSIGVDPADIDLQLSPIAAGFDQPLRVTHAGDGSSRLFIVEKAGAIWIVSRGEKLARPFLDISERVLDEGFEQGLFSVAFHPDFESNGCFFVVYTSAPDGNNVLARFQVSNTDRNIADPDSEMRLIDIPDPHEYHNGGDIAFSPTDGYLYYATGDGGLRGDNAQDPGLLFGKMLRIDVDRGTPYTIPDDNPFVDDPRFRPEIWALGLRNPWRFSFDRGTGDLFIGDVGPVHWEELNHQPADSQGGENYGWPDMEGTHCHPPDTTCDPDGLTLPIVEYSPFDAAGERVDCAIVAGTTYRSTRTPALAGAFVFGDWCSGRIFIAYRSADDTWQYRQVADTTLRVTSFGEDEQGDVYLTDMQGGILYQMTMTAPNPIPQLHSIAPPALIASPEAARISVHGSGFVSTSEIVVNGTRVETELVNRSLLVATLPAVLTERAGLLSISVQTPELGGGESAEIQLSVLDGARAEQAFERVWARTDAPVRDGAVSRSWIWGPEPLTDLIVEPYSDGTRVVRYYGKSRMEFTDPEGDAGSPWFVTNGLLVTELATGRIQTGDDRFEVRGPPDINVAGDPNDESSPTYATVGKLLDAPARVVGVTIIQRVDRSGAVTTDHGLDQYRVETAYFDDITDHTVAAPFWDFMNSAGLVLEGNSYTTGPLLENPLLATGRPITEAYWASITVADTRQEVLIQCFERRCLTYTPENPEGWQVEAGNVGRHYYQWRYADLAALSTYSLAQVPGNQEEHDLTRASRGQ